MVNKSIATHEMVHQEEIEDGDAVMCPACCAEDIASGVKWEYIDGEEQDITCKCGNRVRLICQRPILIQVFSEKDE